MDYRYNDEVLLSINETVYNKFLEYMKNYNFTIESGGIIAGTLEPSYKRIVATDITEPQVQDRCSAFAYKRSKFGHQEIMDSLWENSKNSKTYIGEWHTHNQQVPQPSFIDRRNWLNISRRRQNSNWLFFIIIGTKQIGVWTISNGKIVEMTI